MMYFCQINFDLQLTNYKTCFVSHALLSTHADRQGVDISFTVCVFVCVCVCVVLCVCTVTDFSAVDKASGLKFRRAVHRRPRQGISHFGELCSPEAENRTNPPVRPCCNVMLVCF